MPASSNNERCDGRSLHRTKPENGIEREITASCGGNAIRPTAVGKKTWLFIGEAEAGGRSAIIYTVVESCRRRGLDPYAYLRDVLTRLPSMTNRQVPEIKNTSYAYGFYIHCTVKRRWRAVQWQLTYVLFVRLPRPWCGA